jgi:coenzyme F420-0:L-glutamate ligase / coenzyme F420-1:gamma-L-glutamate ligase
LTAAALTVVAVEGMPEIEPGARVGELMAERAEMTAGDVIVVSQKIVSKAEGQLRRLAEVEPSDEAQRLASKVGKDPALVQLILEESREVLRTEPGALITETRHGFICANAGIDSSNLPDAGTVALLPADPDESARRIRAEIGQRVAVIVSDSFGRPWRLGQAEVAIGCAGLRPLDDWRGRSDVHGRTLAATLIAIADEAAAAADLVRDKVSRVPAAIVRGLERHVSDDPGPGAAALVRPRAEDLFR